VDKASDCRLMESILYGVQGTAMPSWIDYGLSKNDVGDILNFIRSINRKSPAGQQVGQAFSLPRAGESPALPPITRETEHGAR